MAGLKQGCTLKNGKYKIVKTLGQGSFGITYLATTHTLMEGQLGKLYVNVNVTIKEFFMCDYSSRAVDGVSVERTNSSLVKYYQNKFHREAINLSKMHHPNIVKVLEVFDENNTTYYVMEFIDGSTVDDYIIKNGKLSVEESLKITKEVCLALAYMHEHNMLHLDLKPKNIMRNNEGHIFLIDFGLAKQYKENGEPESSTSIGLGTPGYAPIEQAYYKSDGTLPVTIDIYALGASLYKMLIGKTPPESSLVLNEGLPLTILKQANVDDKVIAIVSKAMAPIKKNRYQTVNALSEAISAIILSDDESTFVQDHKEDTINSKKNVHENVKQHNSNHKNRVVEKNEVKKEPVAIKKRKWALIILGVLLVMFPVFKIYKKYMAEKEASMFPSALVSKDTMVVKKYLTDFTNAPDAHRTKVKQRYEILKAIDYIDEHMVTIRMGSVPQYGIYREASIEASIWSVIKIKSIDSSTVAAFKLFQHEITNKLWRTIMGDNQTGKDNEPVEVSYEKCVEFIEQLNKLSDKKYRLPTIAERLLAAKQKQFSHIANEDTLKFNNPPFRFCSDKDDIDNNIYRLYNIRVSTCEWCQDRIYENLATICKSNFPDSPHAFMVMLDSVNQYNDFRIARDY